MIIMIIISRFQSQQDSSLPMCLFLLEWSNPLAGTNPVLRAALPELLSSTQPWPSALRRVEWPVECHLARWPLSAKNLPRRCQPIPVFHCTDTPWPAAGPLAKSPPPSKCWTKLGSPPLDLRKTIILSAKARSILSWRTVWIEGATIFAYISRCIHLLQFSLRHKSVPSPMRSYGIDSQRQRYKLFGALSASNVYVKSHRVQPMALLAHPRPESAH